LPRAGARSIFRGLNILLIITAVLLPVSVHAEQYPFTATNLWKVDLHCRCLSSPALDTNGIIYVTDLDGRLLAINPDGSRRWVFRSGFETVSTPAVAADGSILFGSRNHHLYSVDAAGRKQWDYKTGGWVDASPAVAVDGTVYVGSWDKKLYAVSPDGKKRWEFVTGGPVVSSAAINTEGVVYFGSQDRKFYALSADGAKRWEFSTRGAITSSPAIGSAGEIYFTSTDGKLYSLNADGTLRWNLETGGITASSPVLGADGTIFLSVNQTHCAIAADGKFKWQRAFWHPPADCFGESAAAVLGNNTVVFTGGDGVVMTVPADDGAQQWYWNYWLDGPGYSSPLVASDGTVYAIGLYGRLGALQRDVALAKTSWPTFRGNSQRTGRVFKGL